MGIPLDIIPVTILTAPDMTDTEVMGPAMMAIIVITKA
jgi:hypothetical protein